MLRYDDEVSVIIMNEKYHFFDLDDTLYNEIDYLNSAYKEIALFIAEKSQVNYCRKYL
jgi:hypothetical protein